MINSTKKWLLMKSSGIVLVPFTIWFILNFVSIYDNDYQEVLLFFSSQPYKFLFSIFIIIAFFHSALTISEIFEDYIHVEKIKIVANKLLYFLAIIIPLITIIVLLKFNL
jgi:succinate dehydrogenase / fumarate reductase membrane anchor subunit